MTKANGKIKELGPRNAVYWWLYCTGGGDNVRVYMNNLHTVFVNKYGDTLEFGHVVGFNDINFYVKKFVDTNIKELCGEEDELTRHRKQSTERDASRY